MLGMHLACTLHASSIPTVLHVVVPPFCCYRMTDTKIEKRFTMKLFAYHFIALTLFTGCVLAIAGCNKEERIRAYSVDKPSVVQRENGGEESAADAPAAPAMTKPTERPPRAMNATASKAERMFAAHVPLGKDVWYYKMTGPIDAMEPLIKPLADFVSSVKYENGKAVWKLPEGWKENPGTGMRYATLIVPSEAGPLELAIFRLNNGPDEVAHALANINRWRGQLGLSAITTEAINKATDDITQPLSKRKVGDQTIYFVNIKRKGSSSSAATPQKPTSPAAKPVRMFAAIVPQGKEVWFYKMTGPVETVEALIKPLADFIQSVKYAEGKATWKLPAGWKEQPGNQFRFATLIVPSQSGPLEFTVSKLGAGPEEVPYVAANINRWRGQLGLKGIQIDDINQATDDITQPISKQKVGDQTIYYVNIVGKKSNQGMRPPFAR